MAIGNLRSSMAIIYDGQLYMVLDCEHAKLGRGAAFCRVRIKNLKNAQIIEATLRDSDNIEEAFIDKRKLQYLYNDAHLFHFMDLETYEGLTLDESNLGENNIWLKDNLEVIGFFYDNKLIDLELPSSIELKVVDTMPGFKGDTVKAGTKQAVLETGVSIAVPLFINNGDKIKVDTRSKKYIGRI